MLVNLPISYLVFKVQKNYFKLLEAVRKTTETLGSKPAVSYGCIL